MRMPTQEPSAPRHVMRSGLTLTEVLVAVVVLGIVLVGVAALLTGDLQLRRTSVNSNTATQLASSYMEAIKRTWSVPENYEAEFSEAYGDLPAAPTDPRYSAMTMTLDITCLQTDGTPVVCVSVRSPDLRNIRITVTDSGGAQIARLVSEIGRPFEPGRTR